MIPNVEETKSREIEEIVERIASKMDGRTVTSHEHYREMLAKELVYELNSHHQDMMSEVVEWLDTEDHLTGLVGPADMFFPGQRVIRVDQLKEYLSNLSK